MVTPPAPDEYDGLPAALRVLGVSAKRAKLLAAVGRHKQVSADQLMKELGIARGTLNAYIQPLVDVGMLIPETAPRQGPGGSNRIVWRFDDKAVDQLVDEVRSALTGSE